MQTDAFLFLHTLSSLGLQEVFRALYKSYNQQKNGVEIWFVGGQIRDCLLHHMPDLIDFDLVVKPGHRTLEVTEVVAKLLSSHRQNQETTHFFVLDQERATYRITHPSFQIDINACRGDTLQDDQFSRDFSMNAICYSLKDVVSALDTSRTTLEAIDYFGGFEDLHNGVIRAQNPSALIDDPLRILRAFRLAGTLNSTIEEKTLGWMMEAKERFCLISPERIRDEFFHILNHADSYPILVQMESSGILDAFFPFLSLFKEIDQTYTTKLQVKNHTLSLVYYLEQLFHRIQLKNFPDWEILLPELNKTISGNRKVSALLKLAGLLHDVGKPSTLSLEEDRLRFFNHEIVGSVMAREWMEKMRLSNHQVSWVCQMIEHHMRPHNLSNADKLTKKAQYRFFKETEHGLPLLILALADAYATKMIPMGELPQYEAFVSEMVTFYSLPEQVKPCPLLNGHEIMNLLSLSPGRLIGDLTEQLLELQSVGDIHTKEEAINYLKNKNYE